jgi:hypothetical protein
VLDKPEVRRSKLSGEPGPTNVHEPGPDEPPVACGNLNESL